MRKSIQILIICISAVTALAIGRAACAGERLYFEQGSLQLIDLQNLEQSDRDPSPSLRSLAGPSATTHRYYILQFKNHILSQDQLALQLSGIEVLRYIPDDAYIVESTEEQLNKLSRQNSNVRGFVVYLPKVRLSSELKLHSSLHREALVTVRVQLFKGVDAHALADQLLAKGFVVQSASSSSIVVTTSAKKLDKLAAFDGVEWVAKKSQMKLRDYVLPESVRAANFQPPMAGNFSDLTGYESGTKIMNFTQAWERDYRGQGQVVGVADTGLDTGEKTSLALDFKNLLNSFALGYASKSWGDYVGHGTHVSGSVGGVGAESNEAIMGGAYQAELIMQSLWSKKYETLTTPEDLKVLFEQAYNAGARIHTNSWGDPEAKGVYNAETSQVDEFVWEHPDMVILFASGNDGVDSDKDGRVDPGSVSSPATSKNIISVGASENLVSRGGIQIQLGEIAYSATDRPYPAEPLASDTMSNNPGGIVAFSSRGPTVDGRLKPDVVAPGSNILSNCSHMEGAEEMWGRYNKDYCFSGGTSMATPLTAGAAAVVRGHLTKTAGLEAPSAALIKAVILHTAEDLYPGQFGEVGVENGQELLKPGPNFDQGYGRVDVGRAVTQKLRLVDNKVGLATGESKYYDVTSLVQKVTLVYTDAPGAPEAEKALVNDLDLEVHIGGQIYKSESAVDNTEQVSLSLPHDVANSKARIYVRGKNVPMGHNGKQPYALVF